MSHQLLIKNDVKNTSIDFGKLIPLKKKNQTIQNLPKWVKLIKDIEEDNVSKKHLNIPNKVSTERKRFQEVQIINTSDESAE